MSKLINDIQEIIIDAVAKSLGIEKSELSSSTRFKDLNAKSTNYVHIITALENKFEVEVPFMQLRRKETIEEAAKYVAEVYES